MLVVMSSGGRCTQYVRPMRNGGHDLEQQSRHAVRPVVDEQVATLHRACRTLEAQVAERVARCRRATWQPERVGLIEHVSWSTGPISRE